MQRMAAVVLLVMLGSGARADDPLLGVGLRSEWPADLSPATIAEVENQNSTVQCTLSARALEEIETHLWRDYNPITGAVIAKRLLDTHLRCTDPPTTARFVRKRLLGQSSLGYRHLLLYFAGELHEPETVDALIAALDDRTVYMTVLDGRDRLLGDYALTRLLHMFGRNRLTSAALDEWVGRLAIDDTRERTIGQWTHWWMTRSSQFLDRTSNLPETIDLDDASPSNSALDPSARPVTPAANGATGAPERSAGQRGR